MQLTAGSDDLTRTQFHTAVTARHACRWSAFLDWLSESGLLTSELQSRTPVKGVSMTLDALREGQSTTVLPRDSVTAGDLFNNALLT